MHNGVKAINSDKLILVDYWTGAMTNYHETRSTLVSFRRFVLDEATMLPKKVETYTLDPNTEEPSFEFNHELTEYYGMKNLSPAEFDSLAERTRNEEDLAVKYIQTQSQKASILFQNVCDKKCRLAVYC